MRVCRLCKQKIKPYQLMDHFVSSSEMKNGSQSNYFNRASWHLGCHEFYIKKVKWVSLINIFILIISVVSGATFLMSYKFAKLEPKTFLISFSICIILYFVSIIAMPLIYLWGKRSVKNAQSADDLIDEDEKLIYELELSQTENQV